MKLLLLALAVSAVSAYQLKPSCDKPLYCQSKLLHHVQMARIFPDSKTFVDLHMKYDEKTIIEAFDLLLKETKEQPSKKQLEKFVKNNFESVNELENWRPTDFNPEPSFLFEIKDIKLRQFAKDINNIWPVLGRKVKPAVFEKPEYYSLIPVHNGFIIPGGKFKEFYYWDTYWIIEGLLVSGMKDTVKGIIGNLLELQRTLGHIPNGDRWYYQQRSQPPLLSAMMMKYLEATHDVEFLRANIGALESELQYWLDTQSIIFKKNGKEHTLLRYYTPSEGPRPESYYEDYTRAQIFETEERQKQFYTDIKSAAESGWDFSSRWFINKDGSNIGNLTSVHASDILPVDLNAIFGNSMQNIAYFYSLLRNSRRGTHWAHIANNWRNSIKEVLWNDEDGIWYDWDLSNESHRKYFYPSNIAPLWMDVVDESFVKEKAQHILAYMKKTHSLEFPGGVPTSLIRSGERWDFPNAWPPLVSMVVKSLEALQTEESLKLAFEVAQNWVRTNYLGYLTSHQLFEKYDVESPGKAGGEGEYAVQAGFGWTNGAILQMLAKYGQTLKAQDGYYNFNEYKPNPVFWHIPTSAHLPSHYKGSNSAPVLTDPSSLHHFLYTSSSVNSGKPAAISTISSEHTHVSSITDKPESGAQISTTAVQPVPLTTVEAVHVLATSEQKEEHVQKVQISSTSIQSDYAVTKPEHIVTDPVKPEQIPSVPVKPEYVPSTPAKPEHLPSVSVKPEHISTVVFKPEYVPTTEAKPEYFVSVQTKPELTQSDETKPELIPSLPVKLDYIPTGSIKPEYIVSPVKPETNLHISVKPQPSLPASVKPEYNPSFPIKPEPTLPAPVKPEHTPSVPVKPKPSLPAPVKPEHIESVPAKPERIPIDLYKPGYTASTAFKPEQTIEAKPEYVVPVQAKPELTFAAETKPAVIPVLTVKPEQEYVPSVSIQSDYIPSTPVKPEYTESTPAKPEQVPSTPVKPEHILIGSVKPEQILPIPVKPEDIPTIEVKPELILSTPVKPEASITAPVKPEYIPTIDVKPEFPATPVKPVESVTAPVKPEHIPFKPDHQEQYTHDQSLYVSSVSAQLEPTKPVYISSTHQSDVSGVISHDALVSAEHIPLIPHSGNKLQITSSSETGQSVYHSEENKNTISAGSVDFKPTTGSIFPPSSGTVTASKPALPTTQEFVAPKPSVTGFVSETSQSGYAGPALTETSKVTLKPTELVIAASLPSQASHSESFIPAEHAGSTLSIGSQSGVYQTASTVAPALNVASNFASEQATVEKVSPQTGFSVDYKPVKAEKDTPVVSQSVGSGAFTGIATAAINAANYLFSQAQTGQNASPQAGFFIGNKPFSSGLSGFPATALNTASNLVSGHAVVQNDSPQTGFAIESKPTQTEQVASTVSETGSTGILSGFTGAINSASNFVGQVHKEQNDLPQASFTIGSKPVQTEQVASTVSQTGSASILSGFTGAVNTASNFLEKNKEQYDLPQAGFSIGTKPVQTEQVSTVSSSGNAGGLVSGFTGAVNAAGNLAGQAEAGQDVKPSGFSVGYKPTKPSSKIFYNLLG